MRNKERCREVANMKSCGTGIPVRLRDPEAYWGSPGAYGYNLTSDPSLCDVIIACYVSTLSLGFPCLRHHNSGGSIYIRRENELWGDPQTYVDLMDLSVYMEKLRCIELLLDNSSTPGVYGGYGCNNSTPTPSTTRAFKAHIFGSASN
uniref:Uncharacterized protein n=1 Tax=Timema tahoe TaxID=61484 RepID=A0A7R9IPN6_9NEOP|nr:unnamed protein product [Timema tahoe]